MARHNYKYGKIVEGKLIYAYTAVTATVKDEHGQDVVKNIFNPSDYDYRLAGYKNVIEDPYPLDGNTYEEVISEDERTIYKRWKQIIVPPTPPTLFERVDALEDAFLEFIMGE